MMWLINEDFRQRAASDYAGVCDVALAAGFGAARVPDERRAAIARDCDTEFQLLDAAGDPCYAGVAAGLGEPADAGVRSLLERFAVRSTCAHFGTGHAAQILHGSSWQLARLASAPCRRKRRTTPRSGYVARPAAARANSRSLPPSG